MDKFEDLVVSTMIRPHKNCRADLHHPSFDVEDEAVQVGPDGAPVVGELLVGSTMGVAPTLQPDSPAPVAVGDVDNGASF